MANIYRFLSNARKNMDMEHLIKEIDSKFPNTRLGGDSPLPNQVLPTAIHRGSPTCLYFDKVASKKLQAIRTIAQKQSTFRLNENKVDKNIEFVCLGYQDLDGDIVIYDIKVPYVDAYMEDGNINFYKFFNRSNSRKVNEETENTFINHLRDNEHLKFYNGKKPVALMGYTKPIIENEYSSEYCPTFSEIAKSIVPGNVEFKNPILTGVLTVSPKYMEQTPDGIRPKDGSLECILIDYTTNKNGTVYPSKFENVVHCQQTLDDERREAMDISRSNQPIDGLPNYSNIRLKK